MPFMPNPLNPGPLGMARDIMNYTMNPHLETSYNPITSRGPMGHPIRDQIFERDSMGNPIWGSRVTGRDSMGNPITTPVSDLTFRPLYSHDNLSFNPTQPLGYVDLSYKPSTVFFRPSFDNKPSSLDDTISLDNTIRRFYGFQEKKRSY